MDQGTDVPVATTQPESTGGTERNGLAHVASRLGIVGAILVVGVLALTANAVITAIVTPDFMSADATDDPFAGAIVACVLPLTLGFFGLILGIAAVRAVSVSGEKTVAVRSLVLGIANLLVPIAVVVVNVHFDQLTAACGGG